ncbi:PR-1-like protein [Neocallimastix californiae]|uniref:PR-1-like protein n=1 Tax=Neocallimastix californiae TaxID=1754190 RepID=A0A1Y2D5R8_9FUNG|nr:PR-1-like protein [Neocallimastix californiae]|eukprot:ORY54623.1 PR-1-like protein [Neocallimastix californiae]
MRFNISVILSIAFLACGINAELTSSQKKTLLSLHKEARAKLNASNMKSISWSDSLASAAQSYSEKCKGMVHSHTGPENLAGSTTGDVSRMFNNWMEEKSGFNSSGYRSKFKDISYNGEDIGHYSQIVWADNTEVGCGMTDCPNYSARYLLVCRYKTGNKTTTTHRSTTTTTSHRTSTTTESQKSTVTTEEKETPNSTIPVDTMPTVSTNTTLNTNSTLNDAPETTVPINDPFNNTKDNNDNTNNKNTKDEQKENKDEKKDKDNDEKIIDEVGPSSYTTGTGTYVTGVAVTGSVVGAAAAFVFLKKNPKQYKQFTDNMKTISRSISRGATSVKRSATTVTRKITTRRANPPTSSNNSSSESLYDGSTYRYEFTQNLNY